MSIVIWLPMIDSVLSALITTDTRHCTRNVACTVSLNLGTTQKGVCYNLVYKVINEAFRGQDTCLRFLPSRWWSQDLTPACLSPHSQASLQARPRVISVRWKWLLYLWKYSPTSNTTIPHYPQPGSNRKQCEVIIAYPPSHQLWGFMAELPNHS